VLVEPDRVLLWGWSAEDRTEAEVLAAGWAGALTFPRVLSLDQWERLASVPAPEVDRLRTGGAHRDALAVRDPAGAGTGLPSGSFDLELVLTPGDGVAPVTLTLGCGDAELGLAVDLPGGRAVVERAVADPVRRQWITANPLPAGRDTARVRALVDGSLVEIYVTDGPVFTERLYPSGPGPWRLTVNGPAGTRADVAAWTLSRPNQL
jgi:beta-fructofuranosidase